VFMTFIRGLEDHGVDPVLLTLLLALLALAYLQRRAREHL